MRLVELVLYGWGGAEAAAAKRRADADFAVSVREASRTFRDRQKRIDERTARKSQLEQAAIDKAREKARREAERRSRLEHQADHARTRSRAEAIHEKAATAGRAVEHLDEIATRIDRGEYTPGELRELMKSGTLRLNTR